MRALATLPTVLTGSIANLRIENGQPVCELVTDTFASFETAQFATWINIAALPEKSDIRDDSTRVLAVIPQGSTKNVKATPIIIGVLGWHSQADSIAGYQIPTITSQNENVTLKIENDAANIVNAAGERTVTPVLRGDLTRTKLDEIVNIINQLQTAVKEVSTAAQAPSATFAALEAQRLAQGGSWSGTDDTFNSDALAVT